ncbi:tripartite tricarboxylate transporter substrate binding protein [Limnohabitans sp. Rim8]|uniref:Bug family tripartite tricarboxylate transporter substrate binding protein n=1 Tax=Limnohabitans sp. Rim8 TaxID=1100718 RepID=UPI00261A0015|nr:tripartite tricarboxylate transporter substrate binding protein [Limnohabitans sp. Rim8]
MKRRQFAAWVGALPLAALTGVWAQPKSIQIIVPFGPGGSGDISARMFADFIARKTGQTVVVENRAGANGVIGVELVRKAPADGSVLLLATTSTHLANPSLFKKLPYDPEKDFRLVGSFGTGSTYMLVRPDAPWSTLQEFVAAAKAAPGSINYGHFNASSQVTCAMFANTAGIQLTPIPYKQVNQAMSELIGGQIQVIFTDTVQGDSFVASKVVRALAVHSTSRLKKYPTVPMITETYPNYSIQGGFLGIAVPAATPVEIQQRLNDLMNEAVTTDPMKSRLEGFAFAPQKLSLAELLAGERREREKWRTYVPMAGIEVQ